MIKFTLVLESIIILIVKVLGTIGCIFQDKEMGDWLRVWHVTEVLR